jgi:hypothetical protein
MRINVSELENYSPLQLHSSGHAPVPLRLCVNTPRWGRRPTSLLSSRPCCCARAAVVVLSPETVHKCTLRELQIFLERKARDPSSIAIIPVFIGLTEEQQCGDLGGLYRPQPWDQGVPQPSESERAELLAEWTAVIELLRLQPTVARSEEVGGAIH